MSRPLVAAFVSTVFGAFEFFETVASYEPEILFVFVPLNVLIAAGLVATGWLIGWILPQLGRYRIWILPVAWFAWVAAYRRMIPSVSMALAALIVFAIAAPARDPQPPVC